MLNSRLDFHSLSAPYLARQRCQGKRHLWDPGESLLQLAGRGVAQRAGLKGQREGFFTQVWAANDA